MVSVLFADLVGFTSLAEGRDPEEVRDLLTRYFDTARRLVGRYGGTVEKFIGDAVMAVWGAPTAREDDAERAVRAALDLTAAVAHLGEDVRAPIRARAGVVTGEAAVTLGAQGQGMVAGDVVNTASRVQAVASAGTVLVESSTRRASEAAISFSDAGRHRLKGKAESIQLWQAERVVAGKLGSVRAPGLEPPFVGRDRELRLVKELFHASTEEGKAHLLSVVGIAGIGKSRLAWEFEKYIDGLLEDTWWHRGRCPAYGDGVTYWALTEMLRMRARILEEEEASTAERKLHRAIEQFVDEAAERRWLEPRLAQLLSLDQAATFDREELFGAWRLFFERMAQQGPVVMVFEDIQWADAALLDFVEYLLDWSRGFPIFVLTLGRPELSDKRPSWGAAKRNFSSLYLEPLADEAMDALLLGLVPSLQDDVRSRIGARAEGIPLYAVETIRMLVDQGRLVTTDGVYAPAGPIGSLDVPETLHALIAARLDALAAEERSRLQDASVLGKSFSKQALAVVSGRDEAELDPVLKALVQKDLLAIQADPMSPERGQYTFLQGLVAKVAYETLSRHDRRSRHLAVARYLESASGYDAEEVAEVVAAHYIDAWRCDPNAPDAQEIKSLAQAAFVRAAEKAATLGASALAQRYFERAAELATDPLERARFLERSGRMAWAAGDAEVARKLLEDAMSTFEVQGRTHAAARVSAHIGEVLWAQGEPEVAIERMERAFGVLSGERDEDIATLAAELAKVHTMVGALDLASERIELALEIAEALWLPELLSQALNTKALLLGSKGRHEEGLALVKHALEVALERDATVAALRAYANLTYLLVTHDRYEQAQELNRSGLELARRLGNRQWEWGFLDGMAEFSYYLGDWDAALACVAEIPREFALATWPLTLARIHVARGEPDKARASLEAVGGLEGSGDVQMRGLAANTRAVVLRGQGRYAEALEHAKRAIDEGSRINELSHEMRDGYVEALEACFCLGRLAEVEDLLTVIAGMRSTSMRAHEGRFRARAGALAHVDDDTVDRHFRAAAGLFREVGHVFWLGVTLLEHAEWNVLRGSGGDARPLLDEAGSILERLGARPWVERVTAARARLEAGGAPVRTVT